MSSNRLLTALLGCSALAFAPLAAAATLGTQISGTPGQGLTLTAGTTQTFNTTGAVPAGGLLIVVGEFDSATSSPSVAGCSSWTEGTNTNNGGLRVVTWYCTPSGGIASGATITLNQASSLASYVAAIAYPATVTTHDLSNGSNGTGTSITWTSSVRANASEVFLTGTTNSTNAPDITDDPTFTCIICDSGSGSLFLNVSEKVVSGTPTTTSYAASWTSSVVWVSGYDSFLYTPGGGGGATCTNRIALLGAGQC